MKEILVYTFWLAASVAPALAALDTTTGSAVDLAPILNPMIQTAGMILTGAASAIAYFAVNYVRGRLGMQKLEKDAALQSRIDDIAQKIIGGALARANIKPGQTVLDVHNQVVADAGNRIATALGKEITALGSTDIEGQAKNIVENRLGLMAAAQAGTPVPGPTATPLPTATPSVQSAPVVDSSRPVTQ